ncbi:Protein nedd1 [Mortierella sp. GBA30]|nr:Protein nedd1 [Mortierella sp. GBA30]
MDTSESRPLTQRKRSYSTTAYSSQEEEALISNNGIKGTNHLPTCLLAAATDSQLVCYEFTNNAATPPLITSKLQQPPIAAPGQFDGIQMSRVKIADGVASVKWGPDNTMLAVENLDGRIRLHDSSGRLLETLVTDPVLEESKSGKYRCSISWTPKPQRLYFANGRKVMTWDVAQRRSIEVLETGSRINALAVNADDTLLAIGQNNGFLEAVMSKLEYSAFSRSILGGIGNDGILRLWDTGSNGSTGVYHSFAATHEVPICGMAFSPFNRYLICTAGLDKRYALYDVEKKNVVKNTLTDYALTSVSFKNDGISMAFGTDEGKILLYDLRSTSRPTSVVDTRNDAPVTAIHFQGKQHSSLKRHQTINGHPLKRQNSIGSKTSVFSTKDSSTEPMSITQTPAKSGNETLPRPAHIKTTTLSHPTLNQLAGGIREYVERDVQSAGVGSSGILDLLSSKRTMETVSSTEAPSMASTTQPKLRRPTAPASIPTSTITSAFASRPSVPSTPSRSGSRYVSAPTTPAKGHSTVAGSYPNSRTVSPFAFQTMQSRSPSAESSTSSSSVNTPPGSPSAARTTTAATTPKQNQLKHHHYQYASADSLSKSPSRSSRAKRRKSFGTLLASGGAPFISGTPDAISDENMEILSGQIADRVRNVLLDQEQPPILPATSSSSRTSRVRSEMRSWQNSSANDTAAAVTPNASGTEPRLATKSKDLWMQLGTEGKGSSSFSSASKPKSPPLARSALPPTTSSSIMQSDSHGVGGTSATALLSSSFSSQILENIIEGCLMNFRVGIRNDIQNMHLELLRQFQIQKIEIEKLLKDYTDTRGLQEENERLRDENKRLHINY